MLELFGPEYIFQHITNEIKKEQEEKLYRYYIADALYVIANKTIERSMSFQKRYADIEREYLGSIQPTADDEEKATEIKERILSKLNEGRGRTNGFDESGSKTEP